GGASWVFRGDVGGHFAGLDRGGSRSYGPIWAARGSVDPELLELVAQGAEGDAQGRGGAGLVVAVFLQRVLDGGALDLLDVRGQGAGSGVARVDRARIDAVGGRGTLRRLRRLRSRRRRDGGQSRQRQVVGAEYVAVGQ